MTGGWEGIRRGTGSGRSHQGGAARGRAKPRRGSGLACGTDDLVLDGRPIAVLHIWDADRGCDERCGELRHVVDHNVWRPSLDDLEQVVRTRLELDPDEELGEDEWADARRRKRRSTLSNAAGKRLHEVRRRPDAKRREALRLRFAGDRFADGERHLVPRLTEGTCEWQQRPIVTRQRSAGQERTHRPRLS